MGFILQGAKIGTTTFTAADNVYLVDNSHPITLNPGANQIIYIPAAFNYNSIEATAGLPLRQTQGVLHVPDNAPWRANLVKDLGPVDFHLFDFVRLEGDPVWTVQDIIPSARASNFVLRDDGFLQFAIVEAIDLTGQQQPSEWTSEYHRSLDGVASDDKTLDRIPDIVKDGFPTQFAGFSPGDPIRVHLGDG